MSRVKYVMLIPDVDAPERVAVSFLPDGLWLVTDIPCYSSQIGFLDTVRASHDEKLGLVFESVVQSSIWSTYAIVLRDRDATKTARALSDFESFGCTYMMRSTSGNGAYVSIAVPPSGLSDSINLLQEGHKAGLWLSGEVLVRDNKKAEAA